MTTDTAERPALLRPWLADAEVSELCDGLEQPAAQFRWLQRAGYHVTRKPSGKVLLMRSELERVSGAARVTAQNAPASGPNIVGLQGWLKGRRGQKAEGR